MKHSMYPALVRVRCLLYVTVHDKKKAATINLCIFYTVVHQLELVRIEK